MTRQGRIARLEVSLEQAWRLEVGALAIVEKTGDRDEPHVLVSWEGAEKIQKLEPEAVRFWNRRGEGVGFVAPGSK